APTRSRWAHASALPRGLRPRPNPVAARRRRRLVLGHHDRGPVSVPEGSALVVFGPPGAGKSAGICIPLVQEWDGCVVAASRRRDLIDGAAGIRQHRGRVEVLDPADVTGLGTCTWSPVETCRTF